MRRPATASAGSEPHTRIFQLAMRPAAGTPSGWHLDTPAACAPLAQIFEIFNSHRNSSDADRLDDRLQSHAQIKK
uniref:Uncharacterized protein n=1 Tax=Ralstonia solanacearum TaxID=305 RepID=A0A0S4XJF5_RALSL|nr:protein of unknown function [Ralstonia solanacearum]